MSYYRAVIKDNPLGFWKLDESIGPVAFDSSGCNNNASYINFVSEKIFPLVSQGVSGTTITETSYIEFPISKDYYGTESSESFGTKDTSDNDFSLEAWVYPKQITSSAPILGSSSGVGLFFDNGNVKFSVGSENVCYTLKNLQKTIHIVGMYKKNFLSLYIDGVLVRAKKINNFKFLNNELTLTSGPCGLDESFIIDAPAIYRYSLDAAQIQSHYLKSNAVTDTQIASLNGGYIYRATEKHQSETDKFIYPSSQGWETMLGDSLLYDEINNSIYLAPNKTLGSFIQVIGLSIRREYISSKIEWLAGKGVRVYASTDELNYTECINGSALPNLNGKKIIYIKVDFESTDATVYVPELYYLNLFFYTEKKLFSHNGIGFIEATPNEDIEISNREYPVLSRAKNDGIKCKSSGFKIDINEDIFDLEFIFTPVSQGSGYLFYNVTEDAEFSLSWALTGAISKLGVYSLHINGQDASGADNISSYLNINDINHIFIKLNGGISGPIWFNVKHSDGLSTGTLPDNVYKNVTVYNNDSADPQTNYQRYLGHNSFEVSDSVLTLTELPTFLYSPQWTTTI